MSLSDYEGLFANLRLHSRRGQKKPQKVAMLLAVIDLVEDGSILKNCFGLDDLRPAFRRHFLQLARRGDKDRPDNPFRHLKSSGFWHHHLVAGRPNSIKAAYLDDALFELLQDPQARRVLRAALYRNLEVQYREYGERYWELDVGEDWREHAAALDYCVLRGEPLNIIELQVAPPQRSAEVRDPGPSRSGRQLDYATQEVANRKLGELGEGFVVEFERQRLIAAERPDLARKVKWSSKLCGDGLGYDVRSFSGRGEERFIEVKTTTSGDKRQPFFLSANELAFSRKQAAQYSLYRVYHFSRQPRLFQLDGPVDRHAHLLAQTYRASF